MTINEQTLPGEPITSWVSNIKVACYGDYGTGKSTFGIRSARMRPNKTVIILNTEPYENLDQILNGYPDVRSRTRIIPTKQQADEIKVKGDKLDITYEHGHELALAQFLLGEIKKLVSLPYEQISKLFVVFDTASFVYKHLMHQTMEDVASGRINQARAQFAYGTPKRKFNIMIERLMKAPTDVVVLGRSDPTGRKEQGKGFEYDGGQRPEWDAHKTKSKIWYDATTIIELNKGERLIRKPEGGWELVDPENLPGEQRKELVWWAKILKHKTKFKEVPVFWDPTPEEIFLWLNQQSS